MSDATAKDDELISQDDIDKLLGSGSIDDKAEEEFLNESEDELGELSQDDIDSLLKGNTISPDEEEEDNESEDFELISQDDIDKLMGEALDGDEPDEYDLDDIIETPQVSLTDDNPSNGDDYSSLGDVDLPQNNDGELDFLEDDKDNEYDVEDDIEDDIDVSEEEEGILPSEALDIEACLITQDTIDKLLKEKELPQTSSDEMDKDDDLAPESDSIMESETDEDAIELSEPDLADLDLGPGQEEEITQSEIDDFLKETEDEPDDGSDLISQDDVDDLLNLPGDEAEDVDILGSDDLDDQDALKDLDALADEEDGVSQDDGNTISQDDIDGLLENSDEENEDFLGDMELDEDLLSGLEGSLNDNADQPVILEDYEDESSGPSKGIQDSDNELDGTEVVPGKKRSLKKIMIFASIFIFLAGSISAGYYLFFHQKGDELPELPATAGMEQEMDVETVNINLLEPIVETRNITLEGFLVLAPEKEDGMAYLAVDISIEFTDGAVFREITSKLPFYRDVIYKSIQSTLFSERGDEVTEKELLGIIKTELNRVLSKYTVDKVVFTDFKTG